ncbi:MAG: efflux RND transporter periplasmic adaptor subunit [Planctomycetia bacterium]|nr:efflux RND transporter periplasmic adaptor subunit [Planctomycetia bacterium]
MKRLTFILRSLISLAVVAALLVGGWLTRDTWKGWLLRTRPAGESSKTDDHALDNPERLKLSKQAKANLGLKTGTVELTTYWRTAQMPGTIVERPGLSNRGVSTTLSGIITKINVLPGQLVKPGDNLFQLRLVSEYLQNTQAQLYKTTRDLQINADEQQRLKAVADSQSLFKSKLLDLGYEERRLQAALDTHKQDLLTRGLSLDDVNQVMSGKFLTEFFVRAPRKAEDGDKFVYEVEELKVQLGELVQAGQVLAFLANHQALDVEGKAFEQESPLLQVASKENWPIQMVLLDSSSEWSSAPTQLSIRFIASHIDPMTRMLSFYLPVDNAVRETPANGGSVRRVWRFRPGQRVRLGVPVEKMNDVFVLPREAIVHEGSDAFVFRQNGSLLERKPVYVRYEDQDNAVIANDGSITPGNVIAINAAVQLNRALKAKAEGEAGGQGHDHSGHSH